MTQYLTPAQVRQTYPDPVTVTRLLSAHGHPFTLNLASGDYRPPWLIGDDAVCAQVDPELWFPESGGTPEPAQRICEGCPARRDCLLWAVQTKERFGVWGGMTARARRHLIRAAGRPGTEMAEGFEEIEEEAA